MQRYGAFHPNPRNNSNSFSTTCDNNPQKRQMPFFVQKLVAKRIFFVIFAPEMKRMLITVRLGLYNAQRLGIGGHKEKIPHPFLFR